MKKIMKLAVPAVLALGMAQAAGAQEVKDIKAGAALKLGEAAYEVVSTSDATAVLHLPEVAKDADGNPVGPSYFLFVGGKLIPADKKELMNLKDIDKSALFAFMRDNRTKWEDPESLQALADFLAGLK